MKHTYKYPMVSATATVLLIDWEYEQVILGRRKDDADAFPDTWCVPGGFLNARHQDRHGETLEQTAVREVLEETGIQLKESDLFLFAVYSDPDLDPRGHVINVCYWVKISALQVDQMKAGDDLVSVASFSFDSMERPQLPEGWAFNHYSIVTKGIASFLKELEYA